MRTAYTDRTGWPFYPEAQVVRTTVKVMTGEAEKNLWIPKVWDGFSGPSTSLPAYYIIASSTMNYIFQPIEHTIQIPAQFFKSASLTLMIDPLLLPG